ncbi:MAG: DUF3048 domain-containing protein [Acidimicrobiales bacterium]
MDRQQRTVPVVALLVALGLGAPACTSADAVADGDQPTTTVRPSVDASTTTATTAPSVPRVLAFDDADAAAAVLGPEAERLASTTVTVASPEAATGGGGAPVTTVGGGGGVDPSAIYRGVLGTLDPEEEVAAAVAAPPVAAPGTHPLTGLAGDAAPRAALVVKIDNGSSARPQSGLNRADLVVEEEVEGGITRLAAVFHSRSTVVGPVRSGRTTDIGIVSGLGGPLLVYSGANDVTDALLRRMPAVQNRSAARSSGYWRDRLRRAPSNLYTDTGPHWASATGGPPPALFAYGDPPAPTGSADGEIILAYQANRVTWGWDGERWLRSQGGRDHITDGGERVSATNVVVIETERVATGMVDSSGATVPEFPFVGSGPATVYRDGARVDGRWTRPTLRSVATLTATDGTVIELRPGRTWIELVEAGAGIHR